MPSDLPRIRQYRALALLGSPGTYLVSGITGNRRTWRSLLDRGWVEPRDPATPDNGLRITPDGLRALARGLERYGRGGDE